MATAPRTPADPLAGALPEQRERSVSRPARGSDPQRPVRRRGIRGLLAPWLELTKPRITLLLLVTCVAAMVCAARGLPDLTLLLWTSLGLALSSGGASALNHVLDRDIDALMDRTAARPVVAGDVSATAASIFGVLLMAAAGALLWPLVNPLAAALALAGGLFYVLVYTLLLKRRTVQNIVIGGAAGAVPPLVGWAAVTGELSLLAWLLFAIIFLWTPPHFWALALLIREQYATAGVPMLPVVAGEQATVRSIWRYSLVLVATTLVPVATGDLGVVWLFAALLLGAWLLAKARALSRAARQLPPGSALVHEGSGGRAAARGLFLASMGWLALLFAAAVVDRAVLHMPLA